jgi:hypothetical protein
LLRDVALSAGLCYRWSLPKERPLTLKDTIGNGCAFLDFDRDGNLDILLVGSPCALYKGDGAGNFIDISHQYGVSDLKGAFSGCAVGDYDGDGYPDIYLTAFGGGALLHNDQGRRLTDATQRAGIAPQPWGTAAAWVELTPGSGRLDLIVANYVRFGTASGARSLCSHRTPTGETLLAACGPIEYPPLLPVLYRNQGGGRFVGENLAASGARGRTLGIAACDPDGSGKLGIALANDELPGDFLAADPTTSRLTNLADRLGIAYDREGRVHGGMGLDWGDIDNDGRMDLAVATFRHEPAALYRNRGAGTFIDDAFGAGLAAPTMPYVAFGCRFADFDNDGWLDLTFTNGHVQDNADRVDAGTRFQQPGQLFRNRGDGTFADATAGSGGDLGRPIVGRGLATGDYDNDGRIDLLIVDSEGAPLLLHNETASAGNWIGLELRGSRSNPNGYGARVTVQAAGRQWVRHCHADGSYLSSSDSRVHFGLGKATRVDSVTIRWPDGKEQTLRVPAIDRYVVVTE